MVGEAVGREWCEDNLRITSSGFILCGLRTTLSANIEGPSVISSSSFAFRMDRFLWGALVCLAVHFSVVVGAQKKLETQFFYRIRST